MEERAKDFWIFSYLCNGINFKDIDLVKVKSIDGEMIRFIRAKTENSTRESGMVVSCYINEHIKNIIDRWNSGNTGKDDYLFDILEKGDDLKAQKRKIAQFLQNTNKSIRKIA